MPTDHLPDVFTLDPGAWSPRPAVYAVAVNYATTYGKPVPSNREVFAALRARGFRETKRKGIHGIVGIHAAAPKVSRVPGTLSAYAAGDHSQESKDAARIYRTLKRHRSTATPAQPWDPWTTHEVPASIRTTPLPPLDDADDLPGPLLPDGYSRSTRITSVLVTRAETRWGPSGSWACAYCGARGTTVDHFQPWSVTHDSSPANLIPCCRSCQASKLAKNPAEWMRTQATIPANTAAHLLTIATDPTWTHPTAQ